MDVPKHGSLRRDRLLRVLGQRFSNRLMIVRGGAGFGKSTLLRQALHENELDPAGRDIHVRLPLHGAGTVPLRELILAEILPDSDGTGATVEDIIQAVWANAPTDVAIIIDDLHRLDEWPEPTADLALLLDRLPDNGHLVLATRTMPQFPFRTLLARHEAIVVDEADLRFNSDELLTFAELRETSLDRLGDHGWPALTELRATAGRRLDQDFVAEEVLNQLDSHRLDALQRLQLHGRFDDYLVSSCTTFTGGAATLAAGLPLTQFVDGEYMIHELWAELLPALSLEEDTGASIALGEALEARDELAAAMRPFVRADRPEAMNRILTRLANDFAGSSDFRWVEGRE